MRSFVLIMFTTAGFFALSWMAVPAEPRKLAEPEHPWRRTADGWVKATWLPKQVVSPRDEAKAPYQPMVVPHPLYMAALQVLAVAMVAVSTSPARKTIRTFHNATTATCRGPHLAGARFRA